MNEYNLVIAELSLSGEISLGECSVSTLRRWTKTLNEILERDKYDWRVRCEVDGRVIRQVDLPKKESK